MHAIFRDAIYALRKLTKSPGFTFLAVVTLALGIGLNSAVFSVVNAVLFRPLPVESPGELVNIYTEEQSGSFTYSAIAFPDYLDLIEQSRSFEQLAAYTSSGLILEHGEKSEGVLGEVVSGNYFDLLGVEAALGRTLTVADDRPGGGQQVAVLGYSAWQRRFGGDPGIVGQDVRLNGHLFQVVGVAPPSFFGMLRGIAAEVWIPMRTSSVVNAGSISNWGNPTEGLDRLEDRARRWHFIVGRLAEGVSAERARAEVAALGARWQEEYPVTNENRFFTLLPTNQVRVWPGLDQALYTASFVVMGIVALVLLIACANLANMLLARAVARRKEMATRLALGASRGAIIRQLLIESLTLSLLGGGVGILVALASNAGIERLQLPFPVDLTLGLALDYRVALFTLAMSSLAAIVFGLAPAFEATRANLSSTLGEESRGSSSGLGKRRLRNALVVGQVALTLVLLISAGLAVRSMRNAHRIDPGFDTRGLVVASLSPDRQGYDEEQTKAFLRQLDERLTARPEIQSVGYASHIPLTLNISTTLAIAEGQDAVPTEEWPEVDTARVGPDYLETMGIPLLRGRSFSQWDDADAPRVAVVNETMAAQLWPGEEAIGQRMNLDDDGALVEVIGIARDGKYRTLGEQQRAFFYSPLEQGWSGSQTMIVRTRGDRHEALATIRQQVRELDENLAVSDLQTVEEATATALVLPRAGASLFGLFGVVGLMLATIGIYGVVSYLVSQRTHEIGIRMAMGAKRWDILRLVVREGIGLTAGGVVLGVLVASVATRALSSVLYGVSATDFLTFVGVSLFLTLIALVATVIPAHRASRFDPLVALRQE